MTRFDYDLFVIGAGSGGVRAARMAADRGARVAVAEQGRTGGTCVNLGCVPKKLYVHAAEYATSSAQAAGFGWALQANGFDWSQLQQNKDKLLTEANGRMEALLSQAGAKLIRGRARLTSPHQVEIDGVHYNAANILIATGGHPYLPTIPGHEHLRSSDQMFALAQLPQRALIVGGGYIASEFAGIFQRLGVQVTQIYRGSLFLRGFDTEIREYVAQGMRDLGIDLRFQTDLVSVSPSADGEFQVSLSNGEQLSTDLVLCAIGRRPNIADLGLETVGVKLNSTGAIAVNDHFQTNIPSIYALGDVIDRMQLTPVALGEAMVLVDNLFGSAEQRFDYRLIPTAVFSQPQFATVGLSEEEASQFYQQVDVYSSTFRPLKHALTGSDARILIKLLVDADSDRVLGAHMAGEGAAETIQGLAVALKAGATKTDFDSTVGIHPTSAEEFVTLRSVSRRHGSHR